MKDKKKKKKKKIQKSPKRQVIKPVREPVIRLFLEENKDRILKGVGFLVVVTCLLVLLMFGVNYFTVTSVTVEGNVHYTNEEIQEMVLGGRLGHNSIYLSLKYRDKQIEDVPFIESMSVSIISPKTVKITVYEKTFAGFVEYMGRYFYFDQDGTVVESSEVKTTGIPQIIGLQFDHIVLMEPLPVEDDSIFNHILDISQLLSKYGISAEKIYFDAEYNITLYFGEARIKLGNTDYIDEKIMKLKMILPEIVDKKGVLKMENYTSSSTNVTFEVEK